MNIIDFFQNSAGKWFSQRTVHNLTSGELEAGTSDLEITILPTDHPEVIKLCESHQIDPNAGEIIATKITWDGVADRQKTKAKGAKLLVSISDENTPNKGKLLQSGDQVNQKLISRYSIGSDDVLTIITESDNLYAEERLWYLMPNLRLRTSVVKMNGLNQASFCSEIRRLS